MAVRFIAEEQLARLLDGLQETHDVLVPGKRGDGWGYEPYPNRAAGPASPTGTGRDREGAPPVVLGEVRTAEPLKAFYFRARQKVAEDYADTLPGDGRKPLCLVGVKGCDLKGFRILDDVFSGPDYRDPFYQRERENNLVLSADCTSALEVCFCPALHGRPYPEEGFDLNLSPVPGGWVVEPGTEKGNSLLTDHPHLFQAATPQQVEQREEQRRRVAELVEDNMRRQSIPDQDLLSGLVRRNFDSPLWEEQAQTCVECGACNTVCPTCHCFLLYDQLDRERLARYRAWDSCLIKDFARVAGGANPRPRLWMRLRNRFEKKFDFFPTRYNRYACTGCGRCILACPGRIDIRKVLRGNVDHESKQ